MAVKKNKEIKKVSETSFGTFHIRNHSFNAYRLPGQAIIDPRKHVAFYSASNSSKRANRVLRMADLAAVSASRNFPFRMGEILLDTFTPQYGCPPNPSVGKFLFTYSRVDHTEHGWVMLARAAPPVLTFSVLERELHLYLLEIHFGHLSPHPILTVRIGDRTIREETFYFDLTGLSYQSIQLIIQQDRPEWEYFRFMIEEDRQIDPSAQAYVSIEKVEMFSTIRIYPTDVLEQ